MQSAKKVRTRSLLSVEERLMVFFPDAAGYAFAISYQNDINKVTLENLVIFTTKYQYACTSCFFWSFTDSYGPALPTAE